MSTFLRSLDVPVSGMTAQRLRLDVITENVTKSTLTRTEAGGPYRRQLTVFGEAAPFKTDIRRSGFGSILSKTVQERREKRFAGVEVLAVIESDEPFTPVYDPSHPDADEDGYYYLPNVDVAEEELDAMAATHSYENNLAVYEMLIDITRKALNMGK